MLNIIVFLALSVIDKAPLLSALKAGVLTPPIPDTKFALVIFFNAPEAEVSEIKIKSFFSLDMQFLGQTHIIRIPLPNKLPSKQLIQKRFEEYYFKRFKVKLDKISANIVNLNVSVVGERELFDLKKLINLKKLKVNDLTFQYRKVYFGGKWFDTKVFWRDDLPEKYKISGPAIVEQMDSTIVINPNDKAVVDNFGNLIIDIG